METATFKYNMDMVSLNFFYDFLIVIFFLICYFVTEYFE